LAKPESMVERVYTQNGNAAFCIFQPNLWIYSDSPTSFGSLLYQLKFCVVVLIRRKLRSVHVFFIHFLPFPHEIRAAHLHEWLISIVIRGRCSQFWTLMYLWIWSNIYFAHLFLCQHFVSFLNVCHGLANHGTILGCSWCWEALLLSWTDQNVHEV